MSIAGYFGRGLALMEDPLVLRKLIEQAVEEQAGVEEDPAARLENYDPVLRSHCRLDREG